MRRFPKARAHYYYYVIEIWESLGGKVQRSTTSSTSADPRRPSGPLVRFFEAATAPVCGGSPESLKDIILGYKQWGSRPHREIKTALYDLEIKTDSGITTIPDVPVEMFGAVLELLEVCAALRDIEPKDIALKGMGAEPR